MDRLLEHPVLILAVSALLIANAVRVWRGQIDLDRLTVD